jgi:60 kDa SS-A/Ro ribonucleoprotein
MALVTANVERQYHIMGFADTFRPLPISAKTRLDDALQKTRNMNFGQTDCSLPMVWAAQQQVPVDIFCVITDSETYRGSIHPTQALRKYREKMGIGAKEVVIGMTSTGFTIADPNDAGQLDVVGFDTAVPQLISDFAVA